MPSLCNTGRNMPIGCNGVEGLRSGGCLPKRGTDLPAGPPPRCCQERVET